MEQEEVMTDLMFLLHSSDPQATMARYSRLVFVLLLGFGLGK
jgi:hypothetical protein